MTPLCDRLLVDALHPSWARLLFGPWVPIVCMLGAGWLISPGLAALPVGVGIATLVLGALHALGVSVPGIYWIGSFGCLTLWSISIAKRRPLLRERNKRRLAQAGAIALLSLPLMFHMVGRPMPVSDSTAIWTFHAKALTCDSLWQAPYTREAIWTGTHPEYPLLVPLLHAWTFWATDSFRDDVVRFWVAALLLVTAMGGWSAVLRATHSPLWSAVAVALLLGIAAGQVPDGSVETVAMLLGGWTVLLVWEKNWRALPWVIFAMGMTKNEGWVASVLLVAGLAFFGRRSAKDWTRELKQALLLSAGLLATWLPVQVQLPSRHEQYPSRLLSVDAWAQGVRGIPEILYGTGVRLIHFPWVAVIAGFLVLLVVRAWTRSRTEPQLTTPLVVSVTAMLGVYLAIYTVTPWGPGLYAVTWDRLLGALGLRAAWLLPQMLPRALRPWPRLSRTAGVLLLIPFAIAALERSLHWNLPHWERFKKGELGFNAYLLQPHWKRALALDAQLPPRAVGVLLDDIRLDLNYMILPRRLYPALPEVIAQTSRPWREFRTGDTLPVNELHAIGARWIVRGDRVERLSLGRETDESLPKTGNSVLTPKDRDRKRKT